MQLQTEAIRQEAERLADRLVEHRRTVHRHPEPGFAEHRTAAYIEAVLSELGIPHRRAAGTGVVGLLRGQGRRCVGLRADMDGLPLTEAPGRLGYRSEIDGMAHACGHDAHVAVLLGLAELLAGVDRLPGTVALYFQPAEEGPGGAEPMVAAGVLDDPRPDAIIALHVSSRHPSGLVAVHPGPSTGSDDAFEIVVQGTGGHAAHPHNAVDPVPIAAEVVLALQHVMSRESDPVRPAVLTVGAINGGVRHNVIAPDVRMAATLRTLDDAQREHLVRRVVEVSQAIATAHRGTAHVEHRPGYPVGANDPALTGVLAEAAGAALGEHRVRHEPLPSLGGEDFYAFGATGVPVAMFRLGVADPSLGINAPHHSSEFDLDESALPAGLATFAEAVRRLLDA